MTILAPHSLIPGTYTPTNASKDSPEIPGEYDHLNDDLNGRGFSELEQ